MIGGRSSRLISDKRLESDGDRSIVKTDSEIVTAAESIISTMRVIGARQLVKNPKECRRTNN